MRLWQYNLSNRMTPPPTISVDLIFRFLPDLRNFARSAIADDPVCHWIDRWCLNWPLSSVGIELKPGGSGLSIEGFASDASLLQLYLDRIFLTHDESRIDDPVVFQCIQRSVGNLPELAGRWQVRFL